MVATTPGTPIVSTTTVITTLPGNTGLAAAYVRVPVNNAFVLTAGSSFLLSVNFGSVCTSTLKFSWNRPLHTPTNPVPQTGVTGESQPVGGCVKATPPASNMRTEHPTSPAGCVGVGYSNSQWTPSAGAAWSSFTMGRPWWRLLARQALPVWTTTWLDSTSGLTAARVPGSVISVGTNVVAWCIRAPQDESGVFTIYNVSFVRG